MTWNGIIRADARYLPLAAESVQCCVTSPPYWGLRDYKQEGQIGLERTPEEYVASIVHVFREVWRVLKPDGTLWLNLGDSYAGSWGAQSRDANGAMQGRDVVAQRQIARAVRRETLTGSVKHLVGLKPKDLVGIPWRVAFALQADGWYLRSDIIWSKPNPMPESVQDRPTKAHEYIFLLSKSERYSYAADAIREPFADERNGNPGGGGHFVWTKGVELCGRNRRSVWTVSTRPYTGAHYAVFPEEIPETCIKAGTRPGDVVLDPFFGSGTVGRVAERLNRRWVGCDLGYQDLQQKRVSHVQRTLNLTGG